MEKAIFSFLGFVALWLTTLIGVVELTGPGITRSLIMVIATVLWAAIIVWIYWPDHGASCRR